MSELPNLHAEEKRLKDVINWTDDQLLDKSAEFAELSLQAELSPRAKEQVMKILMRISFEYSERLKNRPSVEQLEEMFNYEVDIESDYEVERPTEPLNE